MVDDTAFPELGVELDGAVATVEIRRPPHNFFDLALIRQLADAFEALDAEPACRAIVLCARGKSFCAGARLGDGTQQASIGTPNTAHLYVEAVRLFSCAKPVVGAIQGPAVGGGLGLALVPELRVACPEARFCANFTRLGFHPGFGLTVTLPALIGPSRAALMFYTGRRVKGEEACAMGLAD
ncbi:MAG: enoyl-CoA hydratase/isomerase family protein, partial [Burkholderiales bacterium]